jgi:membrane protein
MIRRSGNRFADKIMRQINKLARDQAQNRCPLLLIARCADRNLCPFMPKTSRSDIPRWTAGLILAGLMVATWGVEKRAKAHPRAGANSEVENEPALAAPKPRALPPRSGIRPTWRDWKEIARRVFKALTDDRLLAVAAGIVFYGLLAFFPAITALVSFYGLLADPSTIREHLSLAAGILPAGGFDILREQVERILAKGGGELSFAFVFGLSLAIWSANAGMKAMMDALNVIYGVPETRSFIRLNVVSLALTVGAIAMLLLAVGAVVVFPLLLSLFGLDRWSGSFTPLLRWPILFLGLLLALSVLYRFGPSPHGARWRWITPGSVLATVLWVIGSALLSWYLANFANYDATYGSLGAAIGLMVWMWMSSIVVLLGSQLNKVLDRWEDQPEQPMQQTTLQTPAARRAATA